MKRIAAAWCFLAALAAGACTSTQGTPSFAPPSASSAGRVLVREAMNGNTQLVVDVNDLAAPHALDADAAAYVVWLKPDGFESYLNIGAMRVDADEARGRLDTLTPHRQFELLVTVEERANAGEPSGVVVMRSELHR